MKKLLLAWLLSASAHAAITVIVPATMPTQAVVIVLGATVGVPCHYELSKSGSYTPLVPDFDPALFTGANLDSRPGALTSGSSRLLIAGGRNIVQLALDSNKYSRALAQGTNYFLRVSVCGTGTATFTTKTLPYGATFQDLPPASPTGAYNFPSAPETRNYTIPDPQSGIEAVRASIHADVVGGFNPPWGASGGSGSYCADTLSDQGNWHCALPGFASFGLYLYGINPTTGVVTNLGMPAAASIDFGEDIGWATGSATDIYWASAINGIPSIFKWHYTGADVAADVATGTSTDMMGGADLTTLVRAFDSHIADNDLVGTANVTIPGGSCGGGTEYDLAWVSGSQFVEGNTLIAKHIYVNGIIFAICSVPSKTSMHVGDIFSQAPAAGTGQSFRFNLFGCGLFGVQHNNGMLRCAAGNQNSTSYQAVWDFGNGIPFGTGGSTAGVIAGVLPYTMPESHWTGNHTFEFMGETQPIYAWQLSAMDLVDVGSGPYNLVLGSSLSSHVMPAPGTPVIDTNVTLTSASLVGTHQGACDDSWTAPAGWIDGQPLSPCYPHYLQDLAVGDVLAFISGGSITEFIQITVKHSATSFDIQRSTQSDAGTVAPTHAPGELLLVVSLTTGGAYNVSKGLGWAVIMWDYISSPHGTEHAGDYNLQWGIHAVSRRFHRSAYFFDDNAAPTNKAQWNTAPPWVLPVDSMFNGAVAAASGNFFQKHPSIASGDDSFQGDTFYFVGAFGPFHTLVSPFTHVFKVTPSGPTLSPKVMPVFAKTVGKSLIQVDGPGVMITDADDNVWGYVRVAGELVAGSQVGEVYASLSTLDLAGGHNRCEGGENSTGNSDLCIANWNAFGLAQTQQKFLTNDTVGLSMRPLYRAFGNWEQVGNISGNIKFTYDGRHGLFYRFPTWNHDDNTYIPFVSEVWSMNIPADPGSDGIDRTTFVPAVVHLTAPAGLGVTHAQIKFWYAEYGGTLSTPYCTGRREGCVAYLPSFSNATSFCAFNNQCPTDVTALGLVGGFNQADNPIVCTNTDTNTMVGVTGFAMVPSSPGPTDPITNISPFYPAQPDVRCVIYATPFAYATTDTYAPAACASSCNISIPVAPLHTAFYSAEFLDSGGGVVSNTLGVAMENHVFSILQLGSQSLRLGNLFQGGLMQ